MPAPFDTHPWWFVVIVATAVTLVAWIAIGQSVLEHRYGNEINPSE